MNLYLNTPSNLPTYRRNVSETLSSSGDEHQRRLYERHHNNSSSSAHTRRLAMRQSNSLPEIATPIEDAKFILPPNSSVSRPPSSPTFNAVMEKECLEGKESLGGYFTPRETIKRKSTSNSSINQQSDNNANKKDKKKKRKSSTVSMADITEALRQYSENGQPKKVNPNHAHFLEDKRQLSEDQLYLDVAKLELKKMTQQLQKPPPLNPSSRRLGTSTTSLSLNDAVRAGQFGLTQTPPMAATSSHHHSTLSPVLKTFSKEHRGELDMAEKYNYDLSKAQLKASSRTSALLAGFAMVALVELQYDEETPRPLLILLGVVTSLLVSVHLLALMMSTCILPYMEATGCTQDSPHLRLKFYIDLSWLFSTCIGLLLFLVEIGIIFFVKFDAIHYRTAGYITTAMLVPVVIIFVVFSYLIHRSRVSHSLGRFKHKVDTMKQFLDVEAQLPKHSMAGAVKEI